MTALPRQAEPWGGLRGAALRTLQRKGARGAWHSMLEYGRARWYLRHASRLGAARVMGTVRLVNRGTIEIGNRVLLEGTAVRIDIVCWRGRLTIGDGTFVNYGTSISATNRVEIGRNCAIGQYSIIMDDDYHAVGDHRRKGANGPIVIEDDAWLGARVIVLRGSHIGRGAVIGANSLVKGVIPPYTMAVGSPARVVRQLPRSPQ